VPYPEREYVGLTNAVLRGDLHTVLDAFKRGLPVDIRDKFFKTPLMVAAGAGGDLKTCKFLLHCGSDVNAYDNFKWTPLHHACHAGQLERKFSLLSLSPDFQHTKNSRVVYRASKVFKLK
jgi:ankyrin repeat protein